MKSSPSTFELQFNIEAGYLAAPAGTITLADRPYRYLLRGDAGVGEVASMLSERTVSPGPNGVLVNGVFDALGLRMEQRFITSVDGLEEIITLHNDGTQEVRLLEIELGFVAEIGAREAWRLCAIPFRVQLDGSRHDYSTYDLSNGHFQNASCDDGTDPLRVLTERGRLRSEGWAWTNGEYGLAVVKYNQVDIEYSVATPFLERGEHLLRFGGVGTCLYREPTAGHRIGPGLSYTFGKTSYLAFRGGVENGFTRFRDLMDQNGHALPVDYDPPLTWNVLYDLGWHHSDQEQLSKRYTRETVLGEAAKAESYGCELLYLDPGWEVAEGSTLWDETRLGTVSDLVATLKSDYGLAFGFRTILRCYRDMWPHKYMVRREGGPVEPKPNCFVGINNAQLGFWEVCLNNPEFIREKLARICAIAEQGASFLMVDEFDWRGPCIDPSHGHAIPNTAADHIKEVFSVCRGVRERCPSLVIECHDSIWPWAIARYIPTYFQQGFGRRAAFQENWGFEYMWHCIEDLRTGKALSLYYYNLATNIPLYLHITMASDNDNCLFFWWSASTIRHLGIGGQVGCATVTPPDLKPYDRDARAATYRKQTLLYKKLKAYFVRGTFHGINETAHLHVLPERKGGVLSMFNLTEKTKNIVVRVPRGFLQSEEELPVIGARAIYETDMVTLEVSLAGMSSALVLIGEAGALISDAEPAMLEATPLVFKL